VRTAVKTRARRAVVARQTASENRCPFHTRRARDHRCRAMQPATGYIKLIATLGRIYPLSLSLSPFPSSCAASIASAREDRAQRVSGRGNAMFRYYIVISFRTRPRGEQHSRGCSPSGSLCSNSSRQRWRMRRHQLTRASTSARVFQPPRPIRVVHLRVRSSCVRRAFAGNLALNSHRTGNQSPFCRRCAAVTCAAYVTLLRTNM